MKEDHGEGEGENVKSVTDVSDEPASDAKRKAVLYWKAIESKLVHRK